MIFAVRRSEGNLTLSITGTGECDIKSDGQKRINKNLQKPVVLWAGRGIIIEDTY